jgi:hypothetical protein
VNDVQAIDLDLVGPGQDSPLEAEVLSQRPSTWYLTGFLVPFDCDESQRVDETGTEQVGQGNDGGDLDEASSAEPATADRVPLIFPATTAIPLSSAQARTGQRPNTPPALTVTV